MGDGRLRIQHLFHDVVDQRSLGQDELAAPGRAGEAAAGA